MKKSLFSYLLVFAVAATLYLPGAVRARGEGGSSASPMTAEQELAAYEITVVSIRDERLREITRQLVDADRKIPENLTVEEMEYFMEHSKSSAIDVITSRVPAAESLAALGISADSVRDETLWALIRRLAEADGYPPENFTVEDMGYFLEHAEENVQTIILAKLHRNAVPVPMD